ALQKTGRRTSGQIDPIQANVLRGFVLRHNHHGPTAVRAPQSSSGERPDNAEHLGIGNSCKLRKMALRSYFPDFVCTLSPIGRRTEDVEILSLRIPNWRVMILTNTRRERRMLSGRQVPRFPTIRRNHITISLRLGS